MNEFTYSDFNRTCILISSYGYLKIINLSTILSSPVIAVIVETYKINANLVSDNCIQRVNIVIDDA